MLVRVAVSALACGLFLGSVMAHAQDVHQTAHAVDEHYNHLRTLQTEFTEIYRGDGAERTESGTLWLKKPRKMRWEYRSPREKLFVSDGKVVWFYLPTEKQVRKTDFRKLDVTLGHHIPCHLKALRGPTTSPGLLALIPGLRVHTIDAGCSGMAGTWGLKAENYDASLAAGAGMFAELNRPRVLFGSTECSACRLQLQEGTGKRTLHPIQYLAYAYGLLPELEARFHRPLGALVSD